MSFGLSSVFYLNRFHIGSFIWQDILNGAGLIPNNNQTYLTRDLVAAISKGVGATPLLVCSNDQLEELRLCFYKDFKVWFLLTLFTVR